MSVLSTLAQTTTYYTSTSSSSDAGAAIVAVIVSLFLIIIPLAIGLYIFGAIVLSKLFKKAGMKETWPAWVPIYNTWKLLEISGYPGWLVLVPIIIGFIPIINILGGFVGLAFTILLAIAVGRAYGKRDIGWIILLTILPIVGYAVLAFGDAKYTKPTEKDLLFKI